MTVVPAGVIFRNQTIRGTLVANMADVDEALQCAARGSVVLEAMLVRDIRPCRLAYLL